MPRYTGQRTGLPWEMLAKERPGLGKLATRATLSPYLREDHKVASYGFVTRTANFSLTTPPPHCAIIRDSEYHRQSRLLRLSMTPSLTKH